MHLWTSASYPHATVEFNPPTRSNSATETGATFAQLCAA
jgi:hypothetical protein